jgi:hypothetical protein
VSYGSVVPTLRVTLALRQCHSLPVAVRSSAMECAFAGHGVLLSPARWKNVTEWPFPPVLDRPLLPLEEAQPLFCQQSLP